MKDLPLFLVPYWWLSLFPYPKKGMPQKKARPEPRLKDEDAEVRALASQAGG